MAEVVLDKVNKLYENGFHAVQDLDLDIAHGEFLVLVGPSGCGKSTALRMVAGLEDISSGTMKIGERVVNTLSPKDRDIAMVFQSYALYPHMSVADNIAYGLKIRRMDKAEIDKRVKKVADMRCWSASPSSSRAASASAWPWAGPSSESPRCS
jgi:multiple sugar transport system ATP-binding protein